MEFELAFLLKLLPWLLAFPLVFVFSRTLGRLLGKQLPSPITLLIEKLTRYIGILLVIFGLLTQLGIAIMPLIATLGVVGVAIGFASQTALSNVISGFFLLSDPPFCIGDLVRIEGVLGFVHSIDLLCIRLRTFDNQLVRMPNESVLKGTVHNITAFGIRRVDIDIGIAYKEDPERTRDILKELAENHPLCLSEPEPLWVFKDFGQSSLNFLLAVWCQKEDWLTVKNDMMVAIKKRFDEENIEIPFPHLTVYRGSASEPFDFRQLPQEVVPEVNQSS